MDIYSSTGWTFDCFKYHTFFAYCNFQFGILQQLWNTTRKQLEQLPPSVQEQADKAHGLWQKDPYHNSLQFKRVIQR